MGKNHSQSGCKWEEGEIKHVQLQHGRDKNQWHLNGFKKDGTVESAPVSKKVARILLANGISFGD